MRFVKRQGNFPNHADACSAGMHNSGRILPVAVLNGSCLHRAAALPHVEEGELAIVLACPNQAAILHVEVQGRQLALWPQLQLWRSRVVHIPDVTTE